MGVSSGRRVRGDGERGARALRVRTRRFGSAEEGTHALRCALRGWLAALNMDSNTAIDRGDYCLADVETTRFFLKPWQPHRTGGRGRHGGKTGALTAAKRWTVLRFVRMVIRPHLALAVFGSSSSLHAHRFLWLSAALCRRRAAEQTSRSHAASRQPLQHHSASFCGKRRNHTIDMRLRGWSFAAWLPTINCAKSRKRWRNSRTRHWRSVAPPFLTNISAFSYKRASSFRASAA